MDNSNMGYKYMEVIFLSSLLLQQHRQSQEDRCLWVGVENIQHASSIPGGDTKLDSVLIRGHKKT